MQPILRHHIYLFFMLFLTTIMGAHAAPNEIAAVNFINKLQTMSATARAKIHVPNQLLIRYRSNVVNLETQSIASRHGAKSVRSLSVTGLQKPASKHWNLAKFPVSINIDQARTELLQNPNVELVEYDYIVHVNAASNDPDNFELWGLNNSATTPGVIDIDAFRAWGLNTGSVNVVVAVIDTGVDYNHPDLKANMWKNAGEIPDNGLDDDNNGFIDDFHGYDFSTTAGDKDPMDENDHGTHVAGTIGAVGNDGNGISGVNWNVKIMPVRFINAAGAGATSNAIKAINYAVKNGAHILNNSWGGGGFNQALKDTIVAANTAGVLFVAAAGNDGRNVDVSKHFPSGYLAPNVISVAAITEAGALAGFSNWGLTGVDLGAPGSQIYSTIPNGLYIKFSGTSMAAPHVSGVAALLLSQNSNLTVMQLKNYLLDSVSPLASLNGKTVSGGNLNAYKALKAVIADQTNPTPAPNPVPVPAPAPNPGNGLPIVNIGGPYSAVVGQTHFFDGSATIDPLGGTLTYVWDFGDITPRKLGEKPSHIYNKVGTYIVNLRVKNSIGWVSKDTNITVTTNAASIPIAEHGGPYTATVGTASVFDGSASSDPDNQILQYNWDFGDGSMGNGVTPSHVYNTAKSYNVSLFVNVGNRVSKIVYTSIIVSPSSVPAPVPAPIPAPDPGNGLPIVNTGGPYSAVVGQAHIFDGSASKDPLGGILVYIWDFGDISPRGTGDKPSHTYIKAGTYIVNLKVKNALGWVSRDTSITVTLPTTTGLVADPGGPYTSTAYSYLTFDGSGSSAPAGANLTYIWHFGDGRGGSGVSPKYSYLSAGEYTVKLWIKNGNQLSSPMTTKVIVTARVP